MYKVYRHKNKLNGKIYIGITKQENSNNRWSNGKGYKSNIGFYEDIKKYGWDYFSHDILAYNVSEKDAYDIERALIAYYDSTNELKGYNISPGGNLWSNKSKNKSSKTKVKPSKPYSQNKFFQYDSFGKLIDVFNSRHELKSKYPEVNFCCISNCCRNVSKTHLGYEWSYSLREKSKEL